MGRGIEKTNIFITDEDREDFISRLADLAGKQAIKIYAWALLPNHFHLLCKTQNKPLASNMRKLLTGYVVNFNRRHKRRGHLFQNRYKSIVCQEENYLRELVRYIHLNLLRAGMVKDLQGLNFSPWSGHSALIGNRKREWQDRDYVLSFFGEGQKGKKKYLEFIQEGIPLGRRPDLVGGGLIRSLGGWSAVLSLRGQSEKQIADARILGDGDFVKGILSEMDDFAKENLRLPRHPKDLTELAQKVCRVNQVTLEELRSGSRRPPVIKARGELSQAGVQLLGFSGAEIARYLGVTNSCVTRVVSSGERVSDLKKRYGKSVLK
jgi:REP element-mobilizing transposase RayT